MENQTAEAPKVLSLQEAEAIRKKLLAGEAVSKEDIRASLAFLRQDRANAKPKGKKVAAGPASDQTVDALFE